MLLKINFLFTAVCIRIDTAGSMFFDLLDINHIILYNQPMGSVRQQFVLELSLVCYNNAVMNLSDIHFNDYCYDTDIPGALQTHMCCACDLQLLYPFRALFINCCSNQINCFLHTFVFY